MGTPIPCPNRLFCVLWASERLHHDIVYIDVGISAELLEEALLHATLKRGTGISQAECHDQVAEGSEQRDEGGL